MGDLAEAIARIEGRFGIHALARGDAAERHQRELAIATGTSLDRVLDGHLAAGEALAFGGPASVGKLSLALRVVAGAQAQGGMVAWVDPTASFDPLAAARASVDLERTFVIRARGEDLARATAAALRSEGFRLVVVDLGEPLLGASDLDDLAPALAAVRGSCAALLFIAGDHASVKRRSLLCPAVVFERVAWDRRFDRTVGWSVAVRRFGAASHVAVALFHVGVDGSCTPLEPLENLVEVAV